MQDASRSVESKLPEDVAVCHGLIRELLSTHHTQQRRIDHLEHQLDQLLKRLYGPRADTVHPDQGTLFGDPPPEPNPPPVEKHQEPKPATPSKGHGRKALPADLRRETVVIDIPDAEKRAVGGTWVRIGEEVCEKLDYTPSSLFVRRTVRPKYVVRVAGKPDEMRVDALPLEALPRSKAAPGLVADVVVSKLVDHLPLYRQQKRHARQGLHLSRSTLCGWLAETAEVLAPLYTVLKARVLAARVVHTYAGYDELFRRSKGTVVEVGCWAHARRKFVEAEKTSPALAHEAVARIRALYAVEHEAKDLDASARTALRRQRAQPLLDSLKNWLDREHTQALPKTPIGEALTYLANQWAALTVYVEDGDLAIDNNAAERAIKPFAIGRKNWMFFGSDRGGRTLGMLASFTATCELFQLNPWTWLCNTLTRLPETPADQLTTLLPTAAQ